MRVLDSGAHKILLLKLLHLLRLGVNLHFTGRKNLAQSFSAKADCVFGMRKHGRSI
jgi:hypothetical protein